MEIVLKIFNTAKIVPVHHILLSSVHLPHIFPLVRKDLAVGMKKKTGLWKKQSGFDAG